MAELIKLPESATCHAEIDLRLVPLSFLALIAVGTAVLVLPAALQPEKSMSFLDTLFLATSASCVTGLTTVNIADTFNGFGQAAILFLIQMGGLGIVTAGTLFVLLGGRRLSLKDEQTIGATFGRLRGARPAAVFGYACFFVFFIELSGMILLAALLHSTAPNQSGWPTVWQAAFHAVSAFCNAGLSIYPEGMAQWRNYPALLAAMDVLVVAGGIGMLTLVNLRYYRFWRRDPRQRGHLTLQTKLAVLMALLLIFGGAFLTLALEWNQTLAHASWGQRFSWSFFHSVMSRTAGFSTVDVGQMQPSTLQMTLVLMFIGGAPGSMAGGIKTVTAAVLVLAAWAALRRREDIHLFGRRIPPSLTGIAVMILLLAGACLLLAVSLLMITENGLPASLTQHRWLAVIFEAVSAFGTVGLSAGITPLLTPLGKLIIILLMFIGRVGPLFLAVYLSRPASPWHFRYPKEPLSLG